jgi:hypothetical protein
VTGDAAGRREMERWTISVIVVEGQISGPGGRHSGH